MVLTSMSSAMRYVATWVLGVWVVWWVGAVEAADGPPDALPTAAATHGADGAGALIGAPLASAADEGISLATWRQGGFSPLSADASGKGFPTFAVTGFFQADAIWFAQDADNQAVVGDARDVADFRRARLAAKGKAAENVDFMMEYDFGFPGRPSFMDVFVDVGELPIVGHLRVGQWRQPFGMDAITSVRELTFLERALPFALVPFRQVGVGIYNTALEEGMTWAVSAYRFPTDVFGDVAGDGGYGTSTRETLLAWEDGTRTLHLGGGYTYNRPAIDAVRFRSPPEVGFNQLDFRTTDFPVPFFVDTGPVLADSYQAANVELGATAGPWFAQAEWYRARVGLTGDGSAAFHGGYAQLAWAMTGETRPYNRQQGVYGRVTPHRNYGQAGPGAWEAAVRWSYLDLTDGAVAGGVLHDVTWGLNWYLNRNAKFQFNYIHAFLERPTDFSSNADVFALRAQVDF